MLDEVVFRLVCIDNLSCKALPMTASRGLRAKRVEVVCRKLEGLIVRGSKVLVELHRKSGPRNKTSTGRSHDIVLLHGKLRWGSKKLVSGSRSVWPNNQRCSMIIIEIGAVRQRW